LSTFSEPSPFRAVADGVRVRVRLTPRGRRARIDGLAAEPDGSPALKVAVTAAPEAGKANAALIELLAREWRLPRRALALVAGAKDRRKTLHVTGEPAALLRSLEHWRRAISRAGTSDEG
jgi:uncharacterized protein YggU (UPF0235/DUF167 family)